MIHFVDDKFGLDIEKAEKQNPDQIQMASRPGWRYFFGADHTQ
jgi:hypothetical protein